MRRWHPGSRLYRCTMCLQVPEIFWGLSRVMFIFYTMQFFSVQYEKGACWGLRAHTPDVNFWNRENLCCTGNCSHQNITLGALQAPKKKLANKQFLSVIITPALQLLALPSRTGNLLAQFIKLTIKLCIVTLHTHLKTCCNMQGNM